MFSKYNQWENFEEGKQNYLETSLFRATLSITYLIWTDLGLIPVTHYLNHSISPELIVKNCSDQTFLRTPLSYGNSSDRIQNTTYFQSVIFTRMIAGPTSRAV